MHISKEALKKYRSLKQKKKRALLGLSIAEGVKLASEALANNAQVEALIYTQEAKSQQPVSNIIGQAVQMGVKCMWVTQAEYDQVSTVEHGEGVLAVIRIEQANRNITQNTLYLDQIRDPGNLGTLIRSASWFGVKNIILSPTCVDYTNPKVIRATMGAFFHVNIIQDVNSDMLISLRDQGYALYGADMGGTDIQSVEVAPHWALIVGSESHGLSPNIVSQLTQIVSLPRLGQGESLNAAMAGSILLYALTH
jgi:TrmH family RNA methyltransferase